MILFIRKKAIKFLKLSHDTTPKDKSVGVRHGLALPIDRPMAKALLLGRKKLLRSLLRLAVIGRFYFC